ncbi:MAG: hypothetical protein GF317_23945, partial [Candidatus Lokiarchaeota archaeon]|nr:hypothetical protein [Candidatus Lokiarchaeota archaeon]MBD3202426.1 hypothetical protein [Candidatus Lokiarchaeota archaeon]
MGILQDIWVLTSDGITLYNRVFNPKINEQLFGALMSAINQFAEQVAEGGISSFELSDKRFTIIRKEKLLFIASAATVQKEKKVKQELTRICDQFLELYSDKLDNWNSDISIFSNFEASIKSSL